MNKIDKSEIRKQKIKNEQRKALLDPRFAHVPADPRYQNAPKKHVKLKLDNRFKSVFVNDDFKTKALLDPRGRPKNYSSKQNLDTFYEKNFVDDSEASDDSASEDQESQKEFFSSAEENSDSQFKVKEKMLLDPEIELQNVLFSDDSSDDSSDDDSFESKTDVQLDEFEWGEFDVDAKWDVDGNEVEETNRIAICDMDWDRVRAVDLMVLFSSFAPSGGVVKKVVIYPSQYGKERLKEEVEKGPLELVKLASGKFNRSSILHDFEKIKEGTYEETADASEEYVEALRRYQRNKLRYFYAVLECDSVQTAHEIYSQCDRTHFDVIGVTLDLRYVPSDMTFDEIPHDECLKVPENYSSDPAPTLPLLEAKPKLTWDEGDHRRRKVLRTAMSAAVKKNDFDEQALAAFIGDSENSDNDEVSSSDEMSDGDCETKNKNNKQDTIDKFRSLISEIDQKRKKKEIVFDEFSDQNSDDEKSDVISDKSENISDSEDVECEKNLTPFEKYLSKKSARRKNKIKENSNKKIDDSDDGDSNTDGKNISAKSRKKGRKSKKPLNKNEEVSDDETCDLSLLTMNVEDDKKHFDLRKIGQEKSIKNKKQKNKIEIEQNHVMDNFKVNLEDPRFSSLMTDGRFNVDPSHHKFDKSSNIFANSNKKRKHYS